MLTRSASFLLLGSSTFVIVALSAGSRPRAVVGAPAPRPMSPSALLFIPKMPNLVQTARYRRRQIHMLRSCHVGAFRILKAADLPSLKKQTDPADWLIQNLKAEYLDGTGALRISLMAGSRREQALLVNAIAQAFFEDEVPRQLRTAKRQCESLPEQLKMCQQYIEAYGPRADKQRTIQGFENRIREIKDELQWYETELRTPPLLLELAEVPPE